MSSISRTVSVVIPVYNGAATLSDALDSIAQQSRQADEIVVIDDSSLDDSRALAANHSAHPLVVSLESNSGVAFARNVGLLTATSDLVAFLDQDDVWLPHHLATMLATKNAHPNLGAIITGVIPVAAKRDQAVLTDLPHPFLSLVKHWYASDSILSLSTHLREANPSPLRRITVNELLNDPVILTTTFLVERDTALHVGGFPTWLRSADDWFFLLTLANHTDIGYLDAKTALYRVHARNTGLQATSSAPLLLANLAARFGGNLLPLQGGRDAFNAGRLSDSPFLSHALGSSNTGRLSDSVAIWALLVADKVDMRNSGERLLRRVMKEVVCRKTGPLGPNVLELRRRYIARRNTR